MVRLAALVASLVVSGCVAQASFHAAWPDVTLELRDDGDREQAIDQLWVMRAGPDRDRARDRIAAAIARRITDAIDDDQPFVAAALLDQMTSLWQRDPEAIGRGMAHYTALLRDLQAVFAKSGALEPTVQLAVLRAEASPAERAQHLAELDEVLGFADDLAIAENGPEATRGQQLALLQPTVVALPLPWLVDRYVALAVARQRTVAGLLEHQGASMKLVRAHRDLLSSSRRIAAALARGNRPGEIYGQLAKLIGSYGTDAALTARAEIVATHPTVEAYVRLASALAVDDAAPDPGAALAVCMVGLTKYPEHVDLLVAAGGHARAMDQTDQAIALYERALHAKGEVDTTVALRLGKLYAERIQRLASGGRPAAAHAAWRRALAFTDDAARRHPDAVWQHATALAESALGRGLASQGMIEDAKHTLAASLDRSPSIDAYETLATIDIQTDRYADAQKWASEGIALLGDDTTGDRYRRAKLERLAADGLRRAGRDKPAAEHYLASLRMWTLLGESKDLPRGVVAERELDMGRTMWGLGDPGKAVELALRALDHDPDSEDLATNAVAFLIEAGRYRDALDAYHHALGEATISEFHKVYMSLWVVGAAVAAGEAKDRLATDYLASRRGDVWYERLAQLAAGKLSYAELQPLATTGPRRAELAFYGATLGVDPAAATPAGRQRVLQSVVSARMVLDAEYDLARMYLRQVRLPTELVPIAPAAPALKPAQPTTPAAKPAPAPKP